MNSPLGYSPLGYSPNRGGPFAHLLYLLSETAETLLLSFKKGPKLLILIHLCINALIENRSMRLKIFQEELEI